MIVVLTHVAEALHLFPSMRWGDEQSVGHYRVSVSQRRWVGLILVGIGATFVARTRTPDSLIRD